MASIASPLRLGGWRRRHLATPRGQLAACSAMHVVNDGLFSGLYPLLPLVALDLGLSYAQIGAIKTVFSGASSLLQVPAGIAAEKLGEHLLLAAGTGWVALGLVGMALAPAYLPLLGLTLLAGLGGNTQHPIATSVVSRLFDRGRRASAIATLNFAGDIGKVLAPLLVGAVVIGYGWRGGFVALGALGIAFALLYVLAVPAPPPVTPPEADQGSRVKAPAATGEIPPPLPLGEGRGESAPPLQRQGQSGRQVSLPVAHYPLPTRWGIARPGLFAILAIIGMLDAAARGAALTFIPFLLEGKGFDAASMSVFFTVLFAAGAAGKFLCGPLADRYGSVATIAVTELITAAALVGLLGTPPALALLALLPLGFVLNGTSSVLYATVATLVHPSRRGRGYGLYYTATELASALAPIAYGLLADVTSLTAAFLTLAGITALIAPLTLLAGRDLQPRA